jgi:phosphoribosylglycinamide formyltransferase 1
MNIVVFASGKGTTLQSIIDNIKNGELKSKLLLVVSNNADAYALERARRMEIDTYVIKSTKLNEIDAELINVLGVYDIDLIVLAGYLKLIGEKLINRYTIINTHPSLLPKFGGKGMYGMNVHRAVIESKEEYSGATLHFVNNCYDKGKIIKQMKIKVAANDTAETLSQKVQACEKEQLIAALKDLECSFNNNK